MALVLERTVHHLENGMTKRMEDADLQLHQTTVCVPYSGSNGVLIGKESTDHLVLVGKEWEL